MAKRAKKTGIAADEESESAARIELPPGLPTDEDLSTPIQLSKLMGYKAAWRPFRVWLVGITPLICHAWSLKSKKEMLHKQAKAVKPGKEARDPDQEFVDSLYIMDEEKKLFGFPVTAIKKCILSAAHKDKNIPRTTVMSGVWFNHTMVQQRPALHSAMCDMPLVRIYGSEPLMREDMVRIGAGLRKVANFAYRAQFSTWAIKLSGRVNSSTVAPEVIAFLIEESGFGYGIGDWRNEKGGIFGSFKMATPDEITAWELFATGKGPLPTVQHEYKDAAE